MKLWKSVCMWKHLLCQVQIGRWICRREVSDIASPLRYHPSMGCQSLRWHNIYTCRSENKILKIINKIYILIWFIEMKPMLTCLIPCQWIAAFSVRRTFFTSTTTVSPSEAYMVGPGVWPLIVTASFFKQSGDLNWYEISHLWWCTLAWTQATKREETKTNSSNGLRAKTICFNSGAIDTIICL